MCVCAQVCGCVPGCGWGEQGGGHRGGDKVLLTSSAVSQGRTGELCLTLMISSTRACMGRRRTTMRSPRWTARSSLRWAVSFPAPARHPRMEPPGTTTGLPGLCWGDTSTSRLAAGPCILWLGGFAALLLAPRQGTHSPSQHCHARCAVLVLHPPH